MSLHYDGVLCTLYYDRASLSETRLQPFDLGTMDQTPVNATLAISGTYVEGRLVDLIGKERGEKGSVEFDLRVVSLVTFRYGVYRRRRGTIRQRQELGSTSISQQNRSPLTKKLKPSTKYCNPYRYD
ncbi:uncharacterized protein LOC103874628 [Brassica rapa]|uniref:uncharacterized protein LOC103874628 n=1 Tax=Brassica campestris TaxID=3711 RepID=UPI00142E3BB7|nr:uncharacterized protein LOC103874628 [Brassica rapa]